MSCSVVDSALDSHALDELGETLLFRCPPDWTIRKAERVLGTVLVLKLYGPDWILWSPQQRKRRLAEVRRLLSCGRTERATWRQYPLRSS
jgi:hypothetical protein